MKGNVSSLGGLDDADAKDFMEHLKEAKETDLSDIERTGCVSHGRDLKNNHVVVMIPSLGFKNNEKPEHIFRKMLLLFIRKANEMVGDAYSIVYAHTSIDIINQYPLIYKFYSILPRTYKKNLQKMYIIHPNYGIKMFFEFARVFLSHKFYSKLCLLDSIFEFQRIVPPTILSLPLKFLRKEDEDRGLKYFGLMAPLADSFDPSIGATRTIAHCANFIKIHGGLVQPGIFRVPGDEGELNLAKVRLQYSHSGGGNSPHRILLSENKDYLIVGDVESLSSKSKSTGNISPVVPGKKESRVNSSSDVNQSEPSSESAASLLPEEAPTSIVILRNVNTVAQIFKLSIRDLPEALIPYDTYRALVDITRRAEAAAGLGEDWERAVCDTLASMPHHHLSTLTFVINFLREVINEHASNSMDASNISIVFAPTIFRPDMIDPMRAVMEVKVSQTIIREILVRKAILYEALRMFKSEQVRKLSESDQRTVTENPIMSAAAIALLRPEPKQPAQRTTSQSDDADTGLVVLANKQLHLNNPSQDDITHSLSPSMLGRMTRGGRESTHAAVVREASVTIELTQEYDTDKIGNNTSEG